MKQRIHDITGLHSGLLTAIKCVGYNKHGRKLWLCKCKCGGTRIIRTSDFNSGRVLSCGCISKGPGNTQYDESITAGYERPHEAFMEEAQKGIDEINARLRATVKHISIEDYLAGK